MLRAIASIAVILTLISTGALAQGVPQGPVVQNPGSRPPSTGSTGGAGGAGITGGGAGIPSDVSAIHGRPGGVERMQDPYNTVGAAAIFGKPAATEVVHDPSRARTATQNNPYPYGVLPR